MDSLRLYVQEVNLFMRDNLVAMAATALLDCFGKAYIAFVFCADTTLGAYVHIARVSRFCSLQSGGKEHCF